jgi:hypothetical protein
MNTSHLMGWPANAEGLPKFSRRAALIGSAAIGAGLAALPLPALIRSVGAEERVAEQFAAMADAMNELSVHAHGWYLQAGDRSAGGVVPRWDRRWFSPNIIQMEVNNDPRLNKGKPYYVDHSDFWEDLHAQIDSLRPATAPILPYRRRA